MAKLLNQEITKFYYLELSLEQILTHIHFGIRPKQILGKTIRVGMIGVPVNIWNRRGFPLTLIKELGYIQIFKHTLAESCQLCLYIFQFIITL